MIAELFLEGTSMFTLSQLFKYRSGDYNPETSLEKIEDQHIRVGAVCVCVCGIKPTFVLTFSSSSRVL